MLKSLKNRSTLFKFFTSYFLVFVLCLIIMAGVSYRTAVVNLQKEIEVSNMYKLTQLKDNLDMKMREMEFLAMKINNDRYLTPYRMTNEGYSMLEGISQLTFYKSSNNFIEDCFLYYRDTGTVFSSYGSFDVDTLTGYFYSLDQEKRDQFVREINTINTPVFKGSESVYLLNSSSSEVLTYLYPVAYANSEPYGTVIMIIKKSNYDRMIENLLGNIKGSILIFDRDKNVLVSSSRTFELSQDVIRSISGSNVQGIEDISADGTKMSLVSVTSEATGWNFTAVMPASQFLERVITVKYIIWQVAFVIFAFGIFAIIVIAIKNYRPIGNLMKYIDKQWAQSGDETEVDEIRRISRTVESAINQNKSLKAQINLQRPLIKDQVIFKLLKGEIKDEAEAMSLLDYTGICLKGPYYTVALVKEGERNRAEAFHKKINDLFPAIEQFSGKDGSIYSVELIQNRTIALIINMQQEDAALKVQVINSIKQSVDSSREGDTMIAVGKTYNHIQMLNHSFIEALAALESNLFKENESIIFFDNISKLQQQIHWYPVEEQLRYVQSLKQGERNIALETLEAMMKSIAEKSSSTLADRYVCFDIINIIIKTLNEMNIDGLNKEIAALMEFSSLYDLDGKLRTITCKICDCIKDRKKIKDEELFGKILGYVNNKYDDVNLSLETVADEFGLPLYYLSRFFKDHTTVTFTDYIADLRMKKAKKLLSETGKPLKDIVVSIGYTDLTYFMKKFKKQEGITPGQYRELYSNRK